MEMDFLTFKMKDMKKIIIIIGIILLGSIAFSQNESGIEENENEILRNTKIIRIPPDIQYLSDDNAPAPFITTQIKAEDELKRLIFLVHGLGGSAESWSRVAEALENKNVNVPDFHARYCKTLRPDYSLGVTTMYLASKDLREFIETKSDYYNNKPDFNPNKDRNFIIAHSQGGIVTRAMLHYDILNNVAPYGYGGFVTVATPNHGAEIIKNKPELYAFADNACVSLLAGPKQENIPFAADLLIKHFAKEIIDTVCQSIVYDLMPVFFKDINSTITEEYKEGAPFLTQMDNTASNSMIYKNMPKVAFYGVEPNPYLLWRTMNWFVKSPNEEYFWEANDDKKLLVEEVTPRYLDYKAHHVANSNKVKRLNDDITTYWLFGGIPGVITNLYLTKKYVKRKNAWAKGIDWFHEADNVWGAIVGQKQFNQSQTMYNCQCGNSTSFVTPDPIACNVLCNGNLVGITQVTTYYTIVRNTDGVVSEYSGKGLQWPSRQAVILDGILDNLTLPTGSSHMQIRNDDALKRHLEKLLNGDYGNYFYTNIL
jgi:pimeloyl-ACP methyl ester carboxylesterase